MSSILNFTGTLLKNLVSKPITKNYPEEPAVYPERTRGRIVIDIDQCISCGLCVRNCPRYRAVDASPRGILCVHGSFPGSRRGSPGGRGL